MKSRICILLIALIAISALAVLPAPRVCAEEEDPFSYSYPTVPGDGGKKAWIGELAPGESTPWVTVTVTVTGPCTYPVYQEDGWQCELGEADDSPVLNWIVTANPGPKYTIASPTYKIVVQIQVTVPADWTEECWHTFMVKLKQGYDSRGGQPGPRTIGKGNGVHFKVCVKPPTVRHEITCTSTMTDSSFNVINSFDTVFTPRDPKGRDYYKLASTNPGQFMYNIEIQNTGTVDVTSLTITYTIPSDFILKGADPIQVWTGYGKTGTRIWTVTIDYDAHTITITYTLEPTKILWITFHLEYGPARGYFDKATMQAWKTNHPSYTFSEDCVATFSDGYTPYKCSSSTVLYDPTVILGVEV